MKRFLKKFPVWVFKNPSVVFKNIPVQLFKYPSVVFQKIPVQVFKKIPVLLLDPFRIIYRCGKQMYDQKKRMEYERAGFPIHLVFFDIFKRKTG